MKKMVTPVKQSPRSTPPQEGQELEVNRIAKLYQQQQDLQELIEIFDSLPSPIKAGNTLDADQVSRLVFELNYSLLLFHSFSVFLKHQYNFATNKCAK